MKFVRISKMEYDKIRILYESVMSQACHGLFFREGQTYGEIVANIARTDSGEYFATAGKLIKGRGWVESIEFDGNTVITKGSIETADAEDPTCHRIRGMLKAVYEMNSDKKVACFEDECESQGAEHCKFRVAEIKGKSQ